MWCIICKKDGNPKIPIAIVDGDDDGMMATWDTLEEAQSFAYGNILCQVSEVIFLNLVTLEIE